MSSRWSPFSKNERKLLIDSLRDQLALTTAHELTERRGPERYASRLGHLKLMLAELYNLEDLESLNSELEKS